MRVRQAFADVILSDAELGDLRLVSPNGHAESACPATRWPRVARGRSGGDRGRQATSAPS